ncbi:MAG: radical SAM protein [Candidatus Aminicenantes bacterium]|nr:radical SAM protein [Candidatus Aminicenantes bacterium]
MNRLKKIRAIDTALARLQEYENECRLCPRECGVNRKQNNLGFCQTGLQAKLSHALIHYGEEPVLSGFVDCSQKTNSEKGKNRSGSGTLFFSGCNLKCLFCQNYQISWENHGRIISDEKLAERMLSLEKKGALNINLVSPTHIILPILRSLKIALQKGLDLPIVYNSNGYEKAEIIRNLEGIIDIYLPDLKYFYSRTSKRYSAADDYFKFASTAIREMYRQQPGLLLDHEEIATKGLIIRHLVLPGHIEESLKLLDFIADEISTDVCVSLMSQYYPCFRAPSEIDRPLSFKEYQKVFLHAQRLGFSTLFVQPVSFETKDHRLPDFKKEDPFIWD